MTIGIQTGGKVQWGASSLEATNGNDKMWSSTWRIVRRLFKAMNEKRVHIISADYRYNQCHVLDVEITTEYGGRSNGSRNELRAGVYQMWWMPALSCAVYAKSSEEVGYWM